MDFIGYIKVLKYYAGTQQLSESVYKKNPVQFFEYLNKIPYRAQVFEDIKRTPADIEKNGGDCGEKTKLCVMYFERNGIEYNLNFQKVKGDKYHIYPAMIKNNIPYPFDATYGVLKIGEVFNYDIVFTYGKK